MQSTRHAAVRSGVRPLRRRSHRSSVEMLERRELLATFLVQNTNDDTNTGSLRWAIQQANADSDPSSLITFAVGGAGPQTIALGSPLPTVTHPVVIDGSTQGTYAGTPLIVLDGAALKATDTALTVTAGGSTVRALAINDCLGTAISLQGAGGNKVAGCFIGTTADGTAAKANGLGIAISGSSNNTIGGTGTFDQNVISGNTGPGISIGGTPTSNGKVIQGNLIGTSKLTTGAGLNVRTGFNGMQFNDSDPSWVPPDTIAAVGQTNVVETVNTAVRISGKDGSLVSTVQLGDFFPGSIADNLFDPVVFYDDIAKRFVVSVMENPLGSSTSFLNIAFSDVGDETKFSAKYKVDVQDNSNWADFPRFGFNADAIVYSFNMYNAAGTAFNGVQILSIDKSSIGSASLTTVKLDRPTDFTDAPASMHGAMPGQPMYFVESDTGFSGNYNDVHVLTWANPLERLVLVHRQPDHGPHLSRSDECQPAWYVEPDPDQRHPHAERRLAEQSPGRGP